MSNFPALGNDRRRGENKGRGEKQNAADYVERGTARAVSGAATAVSGAQEAAHVGGCAGV
jgi:hypothetical protein